MFVFLSYFDLPSKPYFNTKRPRFCLLIVVSTQVCHYVDLALAGGGMVTSSSSYSSSLLPKYLTDSPKNSRDVYL